ncbi:MAG: SDR family oxidoreductase [Thermoflavifilum sp.]|nr:SDR family oxidoreductase [Thermoflavifilum sp.]MCL6514567.1 SDR family oxidoreductase [Alicyclobacillus sp.]
MDLGLHGVRVLVTAASKGLGFATARAYAREGARVLIASRDEAGLKAAAEQIQQVTGQAVEWAVCDVTKPDDIRRLFETVDTRLGGLEVLINNAGGPAPGSFETVREEDWYQAFELNLMSVVRCVREAIPRMRRSGWGRIVNFTSSSVRQPVDNLILSNTMRAGVLGLAKSLALELAKDGILVNTLGPGRIATDRVAFLDEDTARRTGTPVDEVRARWERQIPLGRYGTPDEFAEAAVFLGSRANGYITGQTLLVDGGMVRSL